MDKMNYLSESVRFHDLAMEQADKAHFASRIGNTKAYLQYTHDSYVNEAKAAELLQHNPSHHMYAILHRSAATLAYRCGEYEAAENLILQGLEPRPSDRLRSELYDLLRKVLLHESREYAYPPSAEKDIIMTLTGVEADNGELEAESNATLIAKCKQVIRYVTGSVLNYPYRELEKFEQYYRVVARVPVIGSFKINMKLVELVQQPLFEESVVEDVYDRVIRNLDMLNNGDTRDLEESFGDQEYYHSFMDLAKSLAPDGEQINAFSLEAIIEGDVKSVVFERTTDEIDSIYSPPEKKPVEEEYQLSSETVTLRGTVWAANGKVDADQVEFYEDSGKRWYITVPENLGANVVRPHFELRAEVKARHRFIKNRGSRLELISISPIGNILPERDQQALPLLP